MNAGDLVRLSTLTTIFTDGRSSVTYKTASKDSVFVCVFLGVEKRKPQKHDDYLDGDAVMRSLGWQAPPPVERPKAAKPALKLKAKSKKR